MKKLFFLAAAMVAALAMNAAVVYDWAGSVGTTTTVSKEVRTEKVLSNITADKGKYNENSTEVDVLKFASSYSGKLKNVAGTDSIYEGNPEKTINYVEIKPAEGGFKAGDVLKVQAFYNNNSDTKTAKVEVRDGSETILYTSDAVINGKTKAGDMTECSYTLEADQATLRIARYGDTALLIASIKVERGSGLGIENTTAEVKTVKTFENGQLIIIKNGVKYNATGAIVK